jgi:hypothetical protein
MNRKLAMVVVTGAVLGAAAWWLWPRPVPRASGPLPQDAYVWQRAWNEPVLAAVRQHAPQFAEVVALAAEVTWQKGEPNVFRVPLNYDALRSSGRPVGLALRIGPYAGPFAADDARARRLAGLAASLVAEAASNRLAAAELQLDFDCAESKLEGYGRWVEGFRRQVAPVPVVITALPSWLKRRAFAQLASLADSFVLQVHSLERPKTINTPFTLCDPEAARRAVERAAQFGRPFRVALPTYGYVIAFGTNGRFAGLSAEGPAASWPAGVQTREVRADPAALAALVRDWTRDRPAALRGIIWYRLPVAGDRLTWSWPTLQAVMNGVRPLPGLAMQVRRPSAGLIEVDARNAGTADHAGPVVVELRWSGARRVASDALLGFECVEAASNTLQFRSNAEWTRLKPEATHPIGWLRLDPDVEVQVEIQTPKSQTQP